MKREMVRAALVAALMAMPASAGAVPRADGSASIAAASTAVEHWRATGSERPSIVAASLPRDLAPALIAGLDTSPSQGGWIDAIPYLGGALLLIGLASRRVN